MATKKKEAKKKSNKPQNDDIILDCRIAVDFPENELVKIVTTRSLDTLTGFLKCLDHSISQASKETKKKYAGEIAVAESLSSALAMAVKTFEQIENQFGEELRHYAEEAKLPPKKKETKATDTKKPKKAPLGNHLSKQEKDTIKKLRKDGASIKAIGKAIHRAEKTVADFVKTLPTAKK